MLGLVFQDINELDSAILLQLGILFSENPDTKILCAKKEEDGRYAFDGANLNSTYDARNVAVIAHGYERSGEIAFSRDDDINQREAAKAVNNLMLPNPESRRGRLIKPAVDHIDCQVCYAKVKGKGGASLVEAISSVEGGRFSGKVYGPQNEHYPTFAKLQALDTQTRNRDRADFDESVYAQSNTDEVESEEVRLMKKIALNAAKKALKSGDQEQIKLTSMFYYQLSIPLHKKHIAHLIEDRDRGNPSGFCRN